MLKIAGRVSSVLGVLGLAACGGGGGDDGGFSNPPSFTIGGTVAGLSGTGLVLQNAGGNNLTITGNGAFTFSQGVQNSGSYNVTVATQPSNPTQTCTVTNGSGTVASANVTSVSVTCSGQVARFLYVPNAGSASISAYSVNSNTGALSAVTGSPFSTEPGAFYITPAGGTKLYVSNVGSVSDTPSLTVYTVNATSGALTELATSPFDLSVSQPPAAGQAFISAPLIHSSGSFGYVTLPVIGKLYGATVNSTTGELSEVAGFPLTQDPILGTPVFNPANTVLFLPFNTGGSGRVVSYTVNSPSGVLTSLGTFNTGGLGANFATLDRTGKFLLVPNATSTNVAVFSIDVSGTLTPVLGSPFNTNGTAPLQGVAVHKSKDFIYITNAGSGGAISTVAGYTINATTGVLTPIPGSPFGTGGTSASPAQIDPTGKFLYVANSGTDNIAGFAINETSGALTPTPGSPYAAGDLPFSVTIDPSGRFLYVPNQNSGTVASYSINLTSGALTQINSLVSGSTPRDIVTLGLQ